MNDPEREYEAVGEINPAEEDQEKKLKHIIADNPMIYMHLNGF